MHRFSFLSLFMFVICFLSDMFSCCPTCSSINLYSSIHRSISVRIDLCYHTDSPFPFFLSSHLWYPSIHQSHLHLVLSYLLTYMPRWMDGWMDGWMDRLFPFNHYLLIMDGLGYRWIYL